MSSHLMSLFCCFQPIFAGFWRAVVDETMDGLQVVFFGLKVAQTLQNLEILQHFAIFLVLGENWMAREGSDQWLWSTLLE